MYLKKLLPAAACALFVLGGCSDDNKSEPGPGVVDEGKPASFNLVLSPSDTRADDDNAIATETDFYTADVFIYSGSNLVSHQRFVKSDFNDLGSHTYSKEITTTTGTKEIYVGLNMPVAMASNVAASGNKNGLKYVHNYSVAGLTSNTSGFVMFSREGKTETFVDGGSYSITAKVDRLVAKITVEKGSNLKLDNVGGGKITNLEFAMRNSNNKIYALQQKENGVVIDPNYTTAQYNAGDFDQNDTYVAVNENGDDIDDLRNKYAPENTSASYWTRETTYASIRATFVPNEFFDANGDSKGANTAGAKTFYVANDSEGYVYYFDVESDAEAFAQSNGTEVATYENGYAYYNMFLNPNGKYNTLRNNYYKTTITAILGLGNPNPGDGGNTEQPVPEPINIELVIDIQPWSLIPYGYQLSK